MLKTHRYDGKNISVNKPESEEKLDVYKASNPETMENEESFKIMPVLNEKPVIETSKKFGVIKTPY